MRNMVTANQKKIAEIIILQKFVKNQSAMWPNALRDILSHAGTTKQETVDSMNFVNMIMKNK